jgi:aminoglycoside phosphotransferase (APT) family kinase protein
MRGDTAAVRAGEELNSAALAEYLQDKIEGAESGVEIEQFPGGHSNLTYLLRAGGREYVLRRGPLGPVAPKAHDMAREYRVLHAVHPHFPEAPRVYHLCEDPSVIGAVFFLMERRHGVILRERAPGEIGAVPDHAQRISRAFVDCLARLHGIDIDANGLVTLGKPEGFVERQVHGWSDRWRRAQTTELPAIDDVIRWLSKNIPPPNPPRLIHNDYKLDNIMLAGAGGDRIEAVLDWEMATVGEPLADLGLTLCYWSWASAPEVRTAGISSITSQPGWFTREELIERYAEKTGYDMGRISYYEVLGVFKLAVIIQQIYFRFWRGQTSDERFRDFGERARGLAELAASMVERFD